MNSLTDKPSHIFNADESGIPLQHCPGRRVAVRGQKHVQVITSGNKAQVTILACANAAGYLNPPTVIFQRKNITKLSTGEIPGTIYGVSTSGWIDGELFSEWFQRHFLHYAPSGRQLLRLLDSHSSHYNPDFVREACNSGVIVFCLPPNTTHVCPEGVAYHTA